MKPKTICLITLITGLIGSYLAMDQYGGYDSLNHNQEYDPYGEDEEEQGLPDGMDYRITPLSEVPASRVPRSTATSIDYGVFAIKTHSATKAAEVKPISQQHVLFQPVGQMVGTMSYVHLQVAFDIQSLITSVAQYNNTLHAMWEQLHPKAEPVNTYRGRRPTAEEAIAEFHRKIQNSQLPEQLDITGPYKRILGVEFDRVRTLHEKLELIELLLPAWKPPKKEHHREKRELITAMIIGAGLLGATGTLLGSFSQRDINRLAKRVDKIENRQEELIKITSNHNIQLESLSYAINNITSSVAHLYKNNPGAFHAEMENKRAYLEEKIDKFIEAIQAAELHRLAANILNTTELRTAYRNVVKTAAEMEMDMIIRAPGHLLQLETSLLRNGPTQFSLLVHVPVVDNEQVFDLFRYHPIPIVFRNEITLVVEGEDALLAIGPQQEHITMSQQDLSTCSQFKDTYFCEDEAIAITRNNATCLSSLYHMDEDGVRETCTIKTGHGAETAYQINPTTFIVYVPKPLTALMECGPRNRSYIHVQGHGRVELNPGCICHLTMHKLRAGVARKTFAPVVQFNWDWNPLLDFDGIGKDIVYQGFIDATRNNPDGVILHNLLNDLKEDHDEGSVYLENRILIYGAFGLITFLVLLIIFKYGLKCKLCNARYNQLPQQQLPQNQQPAGAGAAVLLQNLINNDQD